MFCFVLFCFSFLSFSFFFFFLSFFVCLFFVCFLLLFCFVVYYKLQIRLTNSTLNHYRHDKDLMNSDDLTWWLNLTQWPLEMFRKNIHFAMKVLTACFVIGTKKSIVQISKIWREEDCKFVSSHLSIFCLKSQQFNKDNNGKVLLICAILKETTAFPTVFLLSYFK